MGVCASAGERGGGNLADDLSVSQSTGAWERCGDPGMRSEDQRSRLLKVKQLTLKTCSLWVVAWEAHWTRGVHRLTLLGHSWCRKSLNRTNRRSRWSPQWCASPLNTRAVNSSARRLFLIRSIIPHSRRSPRESSLPNPVLWVDKGSLPILRTGSWLRTTRQD